MKGLRDTVDTSIVLISHNLGVIAELCDYVYVMYAGQIVEQADTFTLFKNPQHPYTKGLLASVRSLEDKTGTLETIHGTVPNLLNMPEGCAFGPRCDGFCDKCRSVQTLFETEKGHMVRCHKAKEV